MPVQRDDPAPLVDDGQILPFCRVTGKWLSADAASFLQCLEWNRGGCYSSGLQLLARLHADDQTGMEAASGSRPSVFRCGICRT